MSRALRILRLCDMFNPRTAIIGLDEIHLCCLLTTTTTTCFALTALTSLFDIDHDIFTPPVMCARHLLAHHADVGCQLNPPSPQLFLNTIGAQHPFP